MSLDSLPFETEVKDAASFVAPERHVCVYLLQLEDHFSGTFGPHAHMPSDKLSMEKPSETPFFSALIYP